MVKHKAKQKTQSEIFWEPLTNLTKKLNRSKPNKKMTTWLFITAALLPLAGWAIGASINPNGWMSLDPLTPYLSACLSLVAYGYISLPAIGVPILIIILLKLNRPMTSRIISYVMLTVSVVISIIVMTVVRDANDSEFTG